MNNLCYRLDLECSLKAHGGTLKRRDLVGCLFVIRGIILKEIVEHWLPPCSPCPWLVK
jgi:hypothetical protein